MKKPMKFKRYEGGGEISGTVDPKEAADKEAGLKASKDDDVGFLQRLRMGNIDDPSSEAYKRFGAGRGRSEAPAVAPAEAERPRPVPRLPAYPNPIFAAGKEQGKRQLSGDAGVAEDNSGPRTKPIVTGTASKPRIVSKKELEDSGMNLRDFLNKERGLTRRKESKSSSPKLIDPTNIRSGRRPDEESQLAPKLINPSNIRSGRRPDEEALPKTPAKGMKSGGSVSSASSRADGCATKGKTKGTMVKMNYGGKC